MDTFHDFTIFYKITICEHKKLEDESNKKNKSIITKENNVASCRDIVINASWIKSDGVNSGKLWQDFIIQLALN